MSFYDDDPGRLGQYPETLQNSPTISDTGHAVGKTYVVVLYMLSSYVNGTKYTETLIFAPGALYTQSLRLSPQKAQEKLQLHLRDHCTFKIKLS